MTKVDYGVINEGTILKLKAVKEYMDAYSSIMHYSDFPKYCYVDCFSGPGLCIRKKTGKEIKGSPVIALEVPYKLDRKSTRLNSSHTDISRMPSSA